MISSASIKFMYDSIELADKADGSVEVTAKGPTPQKSITPGSGYALVDGSEVES